MGRVGRVWILVVCGYSLLRALLAWPLLVHYGVNPAVFLVLDVATAYPLALGQVRIVGGFRGRDYAAVQGWSVVAGGAFLLPYAYLLVAGHGPRFWELVNRYPLTERARGYLMAVGLEP